MSEHQDVLIAARGLQQMNLTLSMADINELAAYMAGHAERLRAWMRPPADR